MEEKEEKVVEKEERRDNILSSCSELRLSSEAGKCSFVTIIIIIRSWKGFIIQISILIPIKSLCNVRITESYIFMMF